MTFRIAKLCAGAMAICLIGAGSLRAESIQSAIVYALNNSEARKASLASIEAQSQQVAIAQGNRLPRVTLFGDAGAEKVNNPSSLPLAQNNQWNLSRQVGVSVDYTLVDGMRGLNTIYREATVLDGEIVRMLDATETLALNAVQAYIDVVRHQGIVHLTQRNVDTHARIAGQVGEQVRAGKLPEADRFRADEKWLAAKLARTDAKSALADAYSRYQLVIGKYPQGQMSMYSNVPVPQSKAALEHIAVTNSLLVRLAHNQVKVAAYDAAISDAEWKPQVSLFAGANTGVDRGGTAGRENTLSAGVRMNWTLYNGNNREKAAARNQSLLAQAQHLLKQTEAEVRDNARRMWNSYRAASERRSLLERSVSQNARIVEAYREEFEAAKRPLLQVLDAERALFNMRVQRLNAEAAQVFQTYKMLAVQNWLSNHFGLADSGYILNANFEKRARSAPRGDFDISAPALE